MTNRITIEFEDKSELAAALVRLLATVANGSSMPSPGTIAQAEAAQAVSDAFGTAIKPDGNGGLVFGDAIDGKPAGGPVVHPPDTRAAINAAAAAGKEELAKRRAAKAAAETGETSKPAPGEETAKRKRGRPTLAAAAARVEPPPGTDLSGDAEQGDTVLDPDSDLTGDPLTVADTPAPPADQAVRERTPAEKRDLLVDVLKVVFVKGSPREDDVMALVEHFGCKIPLVPDDRVDELWDLTEKLCRKYGVPFVDETP